MAIQKTRGFILRREDVRETSVLLTAYTRDFGKLKFISKGARSPEQKFISAYELFALDEIVFYEKKRKNYFLLSQCELLKFFPEARSTLEGISYAVYFAELLDSTTPLAEKNINIYELIYNSLELLSSGASPKRSARIFEIKLLSLLGFMPRLKRCVECDSELGRSGSLRFSLSLGGILCGSCLAKSKNTLHDTRPILAGTINFISHIDSGPFDKIKNIKVSRRVGAEVEALLKSFIGYHLDIRLKTRDFIEKVQV